MKYKKYPNYKDSGVEWLGEIPEHWEVKTLKYLIAKTIDNRGRTPEIENTGIPMLEAKHINGIKAYNNTNFDKFISNESYKTFIRDDIEEGDILFVTVGTIGKTNLVAKNPNFIIAQNIIAFRPNKDIDSKFFLNYFRSQEIKEAMNANNKNSILDSIKISDFVQVRVANPKFKEQQQIATFLDNVTAKIDTLIEKQTKLIEILKEKRQAVISHAVTKGINPDIKMKDSGVEWLGDIPEHWDIGKLKYYTNKIGSGKTPLGGAESYSQEGTIFIRSQNVYDTGLFLNDVVYISDDIHQSMTNSKVKFNDCLLNITGGSIGRSTLFNLNSEANVNQHVAIIRPNFYVKATYLNWYLKSNGIKEIIDYHQVGGNREGLNFEQIGNFPMPRLNIEEQQQIAIYLDNKTSKMDKLIEKANKSIELLKEKRTALISAAVTGKIDVREIV